MRLLIDTHVLIWSLTDQAKLSPAVAGAMLDLNNEIFVSAVSIYEVLYKRLRARGTSLERMPVDLEKVVQDQGLSWLPILPGDCAAAAALPDHHRDPWDRILVAQAKRGDLLLATVDEEVRAYDVPILW
ncbi:PIN domain nuclease [Caulobacter radicis]|uniref:type II toxin-antitoxin system VapC family toxin n=1 Tax=Caulobacter radicis TaxID=2172650 RepID=UPI000D586F60|nr:type II toxin-antitoxin system VapC family toxin [Caulobacter radicis]PVM92311.1 PIN domain nuclease [Caulobacter radicis]